MVRSSKARSKKSFVNVHSARQELVKDIFFIVIGVCITLVFSVTGLLDGIVTLLGNAYVASFIAGIFFTSVFSLAPASVILVKLAEHSPFAAVAFWGALGAMCGDLVLFFFIRDKFADDIVRSLKPSFMRHILQSFHLGFMKWLSPIIGALIIASPLPDEFGLALLGMSKIRTATLMPVSFLMNLLGIYSIVSFGAYLA